MIDQIRKALAEDLAKGFYTGDVEVVAPEVELMENITETWGLDVMRKLERCIRIAYKSEESIKEGSHERILKMILSKGHESTLEHVNITFKLLTNRGVSHEMIRHRIASYTQESTRYVNYGLNKKGGRVVYPYHLINKPDAEKLAWYTSQEDALSYYNLFLNNGWKAQEARGVLPNDLKTEIIVTMNLRSLRNFFRLRACQEAHPDMQVVARELQRILRGHLPIIFE